MFKVTDDFLSTNISTVPDLINWTRLNHNLQYFDLLLLAISTNQLKPKINAFYNHYSLKKEYLLQNNDVDVWADWIGKEQVIDVEILAKRINDFKGHYEPKLLSFDNVYKNIGLSKVVVVLYLRNILENRELVLKFHRLLTNSPGVTYVLRFFPEKRNKNDADVYLSGYGVELAVKSTEYKVTDDRQIDVNSEFSNDQSEKKEVIDDDFVDKYLDSTIPTIKKLEKSEIESLGLKTTSYILNSIDPLNSLTKISQNFPRYSHLIAKLLPNSTLFGDYYWTSEKVSQNHAFLKKSESGVWLNGIEIDFKRFNLYKLLRALKKESGIIQSLQPLYSPSTIRSLLTKEGQEDAEDSFPWGNTFDVRDKNIIWLNDIENDSRYRSWSKSLQDYMRQSYGGQLHPVRRNLYNALFALDFYNVAHLAIFKDVLILATREIPLRFGVIPVVSDNSNLMEKAIYIASKKKLTLFRDFIESVLTKTDKLDLKVVSNDVINESFLTVLGTPLQDLIKEDTLVSELEEFKSRSGVTELGGIFLNGKYLELTREWQQPLLQTSQYMLQHLQMQIYYKKIPSEDVSLYEYFMTLPNCLPRRNPYIFGSEDTETVVFDVSGDRVDELVFLKRFEIMDVEDGKRFEEVDVSVVVCANFEGLDGLRFAFEALNFVSGSDNVRVTFISTQPSTIKSSDDNLVSFTMLFRAMIIFGKKINVNPILIEWLKLAISTSTPLLELGHFKFEMLSADDLTLLKVGLFGEGKASKDVELDMVYAADVLRVEEGESKVVGPFAKNYIFKKADFETLLLTEYSERIKPIVNQIKIIEKNNPNGTQFVDQKTRSNILHKVTSVINSAQISLSGDGYTSLKSIIRKSHGHLGEWKGPKFVVGDIAAENIFEFVVIIDPISKEAQKISGILDVLRNISSTIIHVYLTPNPKMEENNLNRFYRYVVNSTPTFKNNKVTSTPKAIFTRIPKDPLFTLGMDVPGSWMVSPVSSIYDLDNINLSTIPNGAPIVEAVFTLSFMLVQAHAKDTSTNQPPRGLQFILGTRAQPEMADTMTMANLGYVQLKCREFGVLELALRDGRSKEVFEFEGLVDQGSGVSTVGGLERYLVVVDSFEGVTLHINVKRRPGMEKDDVLLENKDGEVKTSIAKGVTNYLKQIVFGKDKENKEEKINIFSVASGHLYERMLSIMMLSVIKNTKTSVKFWLIDDFLSPSFKDFVPDLAKEYNFEFEFVTYKWPHWLREQTEKQRIIWAYKILFLDVLFPLSLDKVIFVDADQVVRTDMKELVDMNLEGAVYGYTPFCDSRPEIEGFRFWKQGYWRDHLAGRPYHISALYVVDLKMFRQLAAGDRIRQQYQMLSADPGSLANLDQDLPNNMIHQLPIFSLPQDWLWCETWCSDESLKTAKTIDLCNNPQTKEPKLVRAKRILPEWEGLDDEVQALVKKVKDESQKSKAIHEEL